MQRPGCVIFDPIHLVSEKTNRIRINVQGPRKYLLIGSTNEGFID